MERASYRLPLLHKKRYRLSNWLSKPPVTDRQIVPMSPFNNFISMRRRTWLQQRTSRAPSQYPKRRLSVRSRKVSKPRDLYLELSDRSENWQTLRQQCCRCACQISKRYDNLKFQSRGFKTLRDLTKRRLFGCWDGAQKGYRPLDCSKTKSTSLFKTYGDIYLGKHWLR